MFTGLIRSVGILTGSRPFPGGRTLMIRHGLSEKLPIGSSVAVNGVCLTITEDSNSVFTAECFFETLKKSNLGLIAIGSRVNLEQSLRANDRLDGHIVQGHISSVVKISRIRHKGKGVEMSVEIPPERNAEIVVEGSVALDGVSLTISGISNWTFRVQLIGETLDKTTLGKKWPGDLLNLETDILLRDRSRVMKSDLERKTKSISMDQLVRLGYK